MQITSGTENNTHKMQKISNIIMSTLHPYVQHVFVHGYLVSISFHVYLRYTVVTIHRDVDILEKKNKSVTIVLAIYGIKL